MRLHHLEIKYDQDRLIIENDNLKFVKMKRQKYFLIIILVILVSSFFLITKSQICTKGVDQVDISMIDEIDLSRIYNITQDLSSYWTRLTGTLECDLAANYIRSTLNGTLNVTDTTVENWNYNETVSSNVVARVNGTNLKDELVIIAAHYDSISSGGTAPGANDNAVAVAVCMEVMRVIQSMAPLNRTLLFLSFAGEEQAFIGSKAWVTQHSDEFSKIIAVINLDMIGYGEYLTLIKNEQSNWLADMMITSSSIVNVTFSKTNSPYPETSRFDHDTFWAVNIPCISIFEGGATYPYYHTENDTIDKISFSLVEKCAQATLLSVLYLGTMKFEHNWTNITIQIFSIWGIATVLPILIYKKLK